MFHQDGALDSTRQWTAHRSSGKNRGREIRSARGMLLLTSGSSVVAQQGEQDGRQFRNVPYFFSSLHGRWLGPPQDSTIKSCRPSRIRANVTIVQVLDSGQLKPNGAFYFIDMELCQAGLDNLKYYASGIYIPGLDNWKTISNYRTKLPSSGFSLLCCVSKWVSIHPSLPTGPQRL
jgi:hypothetical protein